MVLFFAWPEEWLPGGGDCTGGGAVLPRRRPAVVSHFLHTRQAVERYLFRMQAKLLLYAAGIGPAADAAFLIVDRIDVTAIRQRLAKVNVQRLQQFDVSELQALLLEAVQACRM